MKISPDSSFGTCEYCGTTMTLPKVNDEQRAAAFNRGNHFRRIGEFDKALAVYEGIVREDEKDAEAHWRCALCRFGIEYVKDPATGEYLPTCHRASFDNFLEDVDYQAALKYADVVAREQYQKDGEKIAEVQHGILATVQKERPFDVFICYKETGEDAHRTIDSTLAQDIYYQLTEQGRRVFFARITLEDKAGVEYEPYIFAALHSAKVMLVVGTKPEYFNAVWVRNEWSRFLALMKQDRKKLLIPCYRDMDPYDLPEQLSVLQSYDMSKIGFIQDLIRGIGKVLDVDKKPEPVKETVIVQGEGNANLTALIKRGKMALEDRDWNKADEFFDQALNLDAECWDAFFGKALAQQQCSTPEELRRKLVDDAKITFETKTACERDMARINAAIQKYQIPYYLEENKILNCFEEPKTYRSAVSFWTQHLAQTRDYFEHDKLMSRAVRYAPKDFSEGLQSLKNDVLSEIKQKIDLAEKDDQTQKEKLTAEYATSLQQSENTVKQIWESGKAARKKDYDKACEAMEEAKTESMYLAVADSFEKLDGFEDSKDRMKKCREKAKRLQQVSLKKSKHRRITILVGCAVVVIALVLVVIFVVIPSVRYSNAENLLSSGNTAEAAIAFGELGDYQDADTRSMELWNQVAVRDTIDGGYGFVVALKADGTLVSTGSNMYDQLDVGEWNDLIAISTSNTHTVGLKSDGTVVAVGSNTNEQCNVDDWSDIVAISTGDSHTVGLKKDGTVVATGHNYYGQCDVETWSDIIAISAGDDFTVGLKLDGTVVVTGNRTIVSDVIISTENWSNIVSISACSSEVIGVKADGTVISSGITGYYDDWSNIKSVSVEVDGTIGLMANGRVVTHDYFYAGDEAESWSNVVAVCAGRGTPLGLRSNGTVAISSESSLASEVRSWTDIKLPNY